MRSLALVAMLAWFSVVGAQGITAPAQLEARGGRFVSVPITANTDGVLGVEGPAFFRLVGQPEVQGGSALLNLFVALDAPAGAHEVTLTLDGDPRSAAVLTLVVEERVGMTLRAPGGGTVAAGEELEYRLAVTNTGNVADRYAFQVRSNLPYDASPAVLALAPGETGEVTLRARPQARTFDSAVVTATSTADPTYSQRVMVRTTVLAFAGADRLQGPSQAYRVNVEGSYGSQGFRLSSGAALEGTLSDYVRSGAGIDFADGTLHGSASLSGADWRAGYRGMPGQQRLDLAAGPWRGYGALVGEGFSVGGAYIQEPWRVSVDHTRREHGETRAGVGYTFRPAPELSLQPSITLVHHGLPDAQTVGVDVGLGATLDMPDVVATSRVNVPLDARRSWSVAVAASTRTISPLGVQLHGYLSRHELDVGVTFHQAIGEEFTVGQHVGYDGGLTLLALAAYRPLMFPLVVSGTVGAEWEGGIAQPVARLTSAVRFSPWEFGLALGYAGSFESQFTARYRAAPWTVQVSAGYDEGLEYGAAAAYEVGAWRVRGVYSRAAVPLEHTVAVGAGGTFGDLGADVQYRYDIQGNSSALGLGAQYALPYGHALFTDLEIGEEFRWRVGGRLTLRGGFETPEGVVNAFGGRVVGFVTGTVFHDLNRDGIRQENEPALSGATVRAGDVSVQTDDDGSYRLLLAPGSYHLEVTGLPADRGLRRKFEVETAASTTHEVELPVETVVNLTGRVFADHDRDAAQGPGEEGLAYVTVRLLARESGESQTTTTDSTGDFLFQRLAPGNYTLSLEAASLPALYEPAASTLQVTLAEGPTPRVLLGAHALERQVRQSLSTEDLSMSARVEPASAPPGAHVRVIATVRGPVDSVEARSSEELTALERSEDGTTFTGYVKVPEGTTAPLMLQVVAEGGGRTVTQPVLVLVRPGPMGTVQAAPGIVAGGANVNVEATLLMPAREVSVVVAGVRYALSQVGPYSFAGVIEAPHEPGIHEVELWADGSLVVATRFRVHE